MRHLDDGTSRRLVDEPFAAGVAATAHYRECASCRSRGAVMIADAGALDEQLRDIAGAPADADGALQRLMRRPDAHAPLSLGERFSAFAESRGRALAVPLATGVAAAAAIAAIAFTPLGTMAQNFLAIFEPRQFVAVDISRGQLQYLPDLGSFGTMVQHGEPSHREVTSTAQIAALTGISVRLPHYVPPAVPGPVHYVAVGRASASFAFSAAKARAYAAQANRQVPPMPARLDGTVLTLQVGPMAVIDYGRFLGDTHGARGHDRSDDGDMHEMPQLAIIESVAPRLYSTGATARELEAYLLQMPGVPPQLADEIRAIGDPSTTMPIPVPVDRAYSQRVTVDGANGLAVGDNTGVGGMIVWERGGVVYGVGGALPQRELMEVAQSLR